MTVRMQSARRSEKRRRKHEFSDSDPSAASSVAITSNDAVDEAVDIEEGEGEGEGEEEEEEEEEFQLKEASSTTTLITATITPVSIAHITKNDTSIASHCLFLSAFKKNKHRCLRKVRTRLERKHRIEPSRLPKSSSKLEKSLAMTSTRVTNIRRLRPTTNICRTVLFDG